VEVEAMRLRTFTFGAIVLAAMPFGLGCEESVQDAQQDVQEAQQEAQQDVMEEQQGVEEARLEGQQAIEEEKQELEEARRNEAFDDTDAADNPTPN
jgi:hypothetical protein